ncbi:MAG: class I SAM-dependent methyltransferase [Acidobacteriota bacterium]
MRTAQQMIAYALEIDEELLPFVTELLADFDELGSDAEAITREIGQLELPPNARVLDLGCGKGAVAIEIARELGLAVFGVDLYEPFIPLCERAAAEAGVDALCTFRCADVQSLDTTHPEQLPADVAVYAALGDVLGPFDATVGILRRYVRPGGYLVLYDDYVRDGGTTDFERFDNYVSRGAMVEQLEAHGDTLLRRVETPATEIAASHDTEGAWIRRRALELAERHPELREAFLEFAKEQQAEMDFLEANMVAAVWILKRS